MRLLLPVLILRILSVVIFYLDAGSKIFGRTLNHLVFYVHK